MQGTRDYRPNVRLNAEEKKLLDDLMLKQDRTASEILRYALKDYAKAQGVNHGATKPKRSSIRESA
jgi:predicted transcriptional regulator